MNIEIYQDGCCGCGGCAQVCQRSAITMRTDGGGFTYPQVNRERCNDCGLCTRHCPVGTEQTHTSLTAYYGWNTDTDVRMASSSGGVFSALAQSVLAQDGVVYGAVYDSNTKTVVYRGTDRACLDDLRRSKYVESAVGQVFTEIKDFLVSGRKVLFCGSPCHAAGLRTFLKKDYAGLYICDFVCGGAASPAFFREHLQRLEKKYGAPARKINFRNKRFGWKRMLLTIEFENGRWYSRLNYLDSFFNGFIEGIIKRRNCFSCAFADNHYSDLTIADYWGYRTAGVPYDEKGISMVVVNTEQGASLLREATGRLELNEMGLERTRYTIRPRVLNKEKLARRDAFFEDAKMVGFEKAAKRGYMKHPLVDTLLSYLHLK